MSAVPAEDEDALAPEVQDGTERPVPTPVPTQVPVLNIANLLTISRLAMVPFFLLALFADTDFWRWTSALIFAVASITDHIDGRLARRHGLITDFGKIADPIADKALTGGALVGLSVLGELPWWVTTVIIGREVGVTLLRFWVIRHGVIPASRGGKLKTLLQVVAIGGFLVPLPGLLTVPAWIVMAAAIALTVVTGVDYAIRAVKLRALGKRAVA